jgi:hypothetical protein
MIKILKDRKELFINHRHVQYLLEQDGDKFYVQMQGHSWLSINGEDAKKIIAAINNDNQQHLEGE